MQLKLYLILKLKFQQILMLIMKNILKKNGINQKFEMKKYGLNTQIIIIEKLKSILKTNRLLQSYFQIRTLIHKGSLNLLLIVSILFSYELQMKQVVVSILINMMLQKLLKLTISQEISLTLTLRRKHTIEVVRSLVNLKLVIEKQRIKTK